MNCPNCKHSMPRWGYATKLECAGCKRKYEASDFEAGLLGALLLWWMLSTVASVIGYYLLDSALGFLVAHLVMLVVVARYLVPICVEYREPKDQAGRTREP